MKEVIKVKNKLMPIILWIYVFVFTGIVFTFPDTIPIHFNIAGEVDSYGSRYVALIFVILPILTYYGMNLDKRMDPKKKKRENNEVFDFFRNLLTLFFMSLSAYFSISFGYPELVKNISPAFVFGILLISLGNYMPRVPQNYTLGIKTPWTLYSEYVWKKTHRVSGYFFVFTGIITFLSSFFKAEISFMILMISVFISAFGSIGYSYYIYKQEEKKNDNN